MDFPSPPGYRLIRLIQANKVAKKATDIFLQLVRLGLKLAQRAPEERCSVVCICTCQHRPTWTVTPTSFRAERVAAAGSARLQVLQSRRATVPFSFVASLGARARGCGHPLAIACTQPIVHLSLRLYFCMPC